MGTSTYSIALATPQDVSWRESKLPGALHKARAHPEWSSLNPAAQLEQSERALQLSALATTLLGDE